MRLDGSAGARGAPADPCATHSSAAAPPRLRDAGAILVLWAIGFAWYRGCLLGFFYFDDFWVMRIAARIAPGDVAAFFRFSHAGFELYRPLTTVIFFYALRQVFGFDSSGYHAVQLFVFLLDSALVYAIASRITSSRLAGLAIGVLYVIAPGQAVAVYWLAAFTVTGTAFFILLALWCWLVVAPPWRAWLCSALLILGLLASEHAVTLPLLIAIVGIATAPRARWRQHAIELVPLVVIVAAYGLAKLVYFVAVRPISFGYAVGLDVRVWLEHLGRYAIAAFNVATLLRPNDVACRILGTGLVAMLLVSAHVARRRGGPWVLIGAGLAFFVVSLAPVFPIASHYKDHYVGLPLLGLGLAIVATCQLMTSRWRELTAGIAGALLVLDLATGHRAWKQKTDFHLVVEDGRRSADWVETLQMIAQRDGSERPVFVPKDPTTLMLFGMGRVQEYFPSLPARVALFVPGKLGNAAQGATVVETTADLPARRALPGWDTRWAFLRRLASSADY